MQILAVDIGGTFIKYAPMDEELRLLSRGRVPTPQEGREQLIEAIGRLWDGCPEAEGIAISMPGIIDSENGRCVMGGALRYNDGFCLRDRLYERCPGKIYIENDAKCAAMAEAAAGSLKDVSDGFVLIFGTMIGGAYIQDRRLHRGKHFSAGEVSYITTVRDGVPAWDTVWGNRCGTPRLCAMFAEKKGLPPEAVDGVQVFEAVSRGDEDAAACLRAFTREIAVQLFNLQTVLDPERFAIGGGISAQPVLIESIRAHLDAMYAACPYQVPRAEVVACRFQNDANLIGAVQCFLNAWYPQLN